MPSAGEEHNMPLPKEQPLEMFAGESETAYNQKLNQNHLNRSMEMEDGERCRRLHT